MTQEVIRTLTEQAIREHFGEHYNPELSLGENKADKVDIHDLEDLLEHFFKMEDGHMRGKLRHDMSFDFVLKTVELRIK